MSFDGVLKELASDLGSGFDFDLAQPFEIVVVKLFVVSVDGVELGLVLVERVNGFEEVFPCRMLGLRFLMILERVVRLRSAYSFRFVPVSAVIGKGSTGLRNLSVFCWHRLA